MITLRFPLRKLLVAAVTALGMFGAMIIASGPAAAYPPTESYPTNAVSDPRATVVAPPHSGGSFKGDISVDYCFNGYYAIGRGMDDAIWASKFNGSTWSDWKSLGGSTSSTPVLYNTPRLAANYCVIYIRAKSTNKLNDNKLNFADLKPDLSQAIWTATPALLGAEPTIAFYNGSDTMAVRGTDGIIYTGNLTIGGVASWTSQGGQTSYAPALRGEYTSSGSYLGWCLSVIGGDKAWWEKCSYGTNANIWITQNGSFTGAPGSFYSSIYGYSIRGARASDGNLWIRTDSTAWFGVCRGSTAQCKATAMTTDRPGFGYNNYPGGTGKLWVGVLRPDGRTWQSTNTNSTNSADVTSWAAFAKLG